MSEATGTIGDRILHLLRTGGRADRGTPYEQKDLVAWLNGEERAPDGNYSQDSNGSESIIPFLQFNA